MPGSTSPEMEMTYTVCFDAAADESGAARAIESKPENKPASIKQGKTQEQMTEGFAKVFKMNVIGVIIEGCSLRKNSVVSESYRANMVLKLL